MEMTTVLGNITVTGWARTELGLSSTKEIDSVKDMKVSGYLSYQGNGQLSRERGQGETLCLEINACSTLGNGVSICTALKWTHLGYALIYGPRKGFGPEDSGYREINRRRASVRAWRGRSADLEPPGDYQLSVGVEMRSGWPNLQTQVKKFQEKSDLEKSNCDEGS